MNRGVRRYHFGACDWSHKCHSVPDTTRGVFEEHRGVAEKIANEAEELAKTLYREAKEGKGIDQKDLRNRARGLKNQRKSFRRNATISGAEIQSRGRCPKLKPWNSNPLIVGIPTGAIVLHPNGEHTVHEPAPAELRITKSVSAVPDSACLPRLWLQSLEDWTGGDRGVIDYIQRASGYFLSGLIEEQKLFFWHGPSATGKTVCTETIRYVLGDYGGSADSETFLSRRYDQHTEEIARLQGLRFVVANEIPASRKWNTKRVTEITGGGQLTARFMHRGSFNFTPCFKLVFAGNDLPNLQGKSPAMIRRLAILPFVETLPPNRRNPRLAEELKAEAPGILAWMLEGYRMWRAVGLNPPPAVTAAVKAYEAEQDRITEWLGEHCTLEEGAFVAYGEAYESYTGWAEGEGEKPMSKRRFCKELRESAATLREGQKARKKGLHGLRLEKKPIRAEANGSPF